MKFRNLKLLLNGLFFALVFSQICLTAQAQICSREKTPSFQSGYNAADESVKNKVRYQIFNGKGNSFPKELINLQARLLPYLAPYFKENDENIRLKAVRFAGATKSKEALTLLAAAVEDNSVEVQNAAARTLYENYEQNILAEQVFVENALCRSVEKGSNAAEAFLLLSRFTSSPQVENVLTFRAQSAGESKAKFYPLKDSVNVSFLIKMALSEIGGKTLRREFRQALGTASLEDLAFAVWAMGELGDTDLLHALRKTLSDKRKISYENEKGQIVTRRLSDAAIEKFVQRLKLKPPFKIVKGKSYTDAEASQLNDLIYKKIPQS